MSCRSSSPSPHSALFVDNNVQAPLVTSVLGAAVDLPLPPGTHEPDDKSQSRSARTLESNSPGSSTLSKRAKSNNLGLNTPEAQKKLGKFFKGLGPSKASSLPLVPALILFHSTRDIRCILPFAYRHALATPEHCFVISFCHVVCLRSIPGLGFIVDVRPATLQPSLRDRSFSRWCFHL